MILQEFEFFDWFGHGEIFPVEMKKEVLNLKRTIWSR